MKASPVRCGAARGSGMAVAIRLYGFWRSAAAFRVRIALNLKGLAYEEVMVDIDSGALAGGEYGGMNPQGSVPSLIDGAGPAIVESLAILEYLDEAYPQHPLLPADARGRARVRGLAQLIACDAHPLLVPRVRRFLQDELAAGDAGWKAWTRHWYGAGLRLMESSLGAGPTGVFCHGDAPTQADLCLVSHVVNAKLFGVEVARYPVVQRVAEACLAHEAFARALPMRQPGAPTPQA